MKMKRWQKNVSQWWRSNNGERPIEYHIAHLHEEVSEMFKEIRAGHSPDHIYFVDGKPEGFPIEMADVVLICVGLAELCGFDLEKAMEIKHAYNVERKSK